MKRYISAFLFSSCFGILCACAARADMMLHVRHTFSACLRSIGLL